jgi:hypothetical protein
MRPALILILTLAAACSSVTAARDRDRIARYLRELPACSGHGVTRSVVEASPETSPTRLRGNLVRGTATCTLRACARACCNGCGGRWLLSAPEGAGAEPSRAITLLDRDGRLLSWGATDCSLRTLDREIHPVLAVATGAIRKRTAHYGDDNPFVMEVSELCVQRAP